MNCNRAREALSAMADGEDPAVAAHRLDRHLLACEPCRAFFAGLPSISLDEGRTDLASVGEPPPDLPARIVARLERERLAGPAAASSGPDRTAARQPVSIWRIGLVALGIGQFLAALPALAGRMNADVLHANHDLAAIELALSACFVLAAFRPRQAAGFVPLLAAVVGFLSLVAIADVAAGRIAATSELPHLVDALALVMLVAVARRHPGPVVRAGVA